MANYHHRLKNLIWFRIVSPFFILALIVSSDEGFFSCENPQWTQVGMKIDGHGPNDNFGYDISLSANGQFLIVGAIFADGVNGVKTGHARVFRRVDSSPPRWEQIGQDLDGEASGDDYGYSVAISDDGMVVAVGGKYNDNVGGPSYDAFYDCLDGDGFHAGTNSGHVRVFRRDSMNSLGWTQIGQDIDGGYRCNFVGRELVMNGKGDVLAIGSRDFDDNRKGAAEVYRLTSETLEWEQVGETLYGNAENDLYGRHMALSNSGDILAIGARSSGTIQVFRRDELTTLGWVQEGADIVDDYHSYGTSVSMSHDGSVVAIGTEGIDEGDHVRVFRRDTSSDLGWTQIGEDIGTLGYVGASVSLSADGNIIAIGIASNDDNGINSSRVRVFHRDSSIDLGWKQVGADMSGDGANDSFGHCVSISGDGDVVASSAAVDLMHIGGNSMPRGYVKVFEVCAEDCVDSGEEIIPGISCDSISDLEPPSIEDACGSSIVSNFCPCLCMIYQP